MEASGNAYERHEQASRQVNSLRTLASGGFSTADEPWRLAARSELSAKEQRGEAREVARVLADTERKNAADTATREAHRARASMMLPKQEAEVSRLRQEHEEARAAAEVTGQNPDSPEDVAALERRGQTGQAWVAAVAERDTMRALARSSPGLQRESLTEAVRSLAAKEGRVETRRVEAEADRAFEAEVGTDRARAQAALPKAQAAWEAAAAKNRKAQAALASAEVGTPEYQTRLDAVRSARAEQAALSDAYTRLSHLSDATRQTAAANPNSVERGRTALTEKEGRVEARRVEAAAAEADQIARLAAARKAAKVEERARAAEAATAAASLAPPAEPAARPAYTTRTGVGRRSNLRVRL